LCHGSRFSRRDGFSDFAGHSFRSDRRNAVTGAANFREADDRRKREDDADAGNDDRNRSQDNGDKLDLC
jgi:hypothetical protein